MCHSEITTKRKTECRRHGQNIAVGGADRHNPRKQYPTQIEPQSGGGKRSAIEMPQLQSLMSADIGVSPHKSGIKKHTCKSQPKPIVYPKD